MKQIPLLQGKALLVELPDGATKPHINRVGSTTLIVCHTKSAGDGYHQHNILIPPGNWRIIGMLSEVTEEQAGGIVSKVMNGQHFQNYSFTSPANRWVNTALESLESAILAEGWYFENPYGEEPTHLEHMRAGWMDNPITNDVRRVWNWKEAQSRVLDHSRCLLLGRDE